MWRVSCVQEHLPPQLQDLISRLGRQDILFTAEHLKQYTSDNPAGGGKIYMAILGEVFDVSAKPEFYGRQQYLARRNMSSRHGNWLSRSTRQMRSCVQQEAVAAALHHARAWASSADSNNACWVVSCCAVPTGAGEGYGHFAGVDGSKSFITGDTCAPVCRSSFLGILFYNKLTFCTLDCIVSCQLPTALSSLPAIVHVYDQRLPVVGHGMTLQWLWVLSYQRCVCHPPPLAR